MVPIELVNEMQLALSARNHELIKLLHAANEKAIVLRNELDMRPPPCDLIDAQTRAERAEKALAKLKKAKRKK